MRKNLATVSFRMSSDHLLDVRREMRRKVVRIIGDEVRDMCRMYLDAIRETQN